MKADKSLEEVWDWKNKVYEQTKNLSLKEAAAEISRGAEELSRRYNLGLKKLLSTGKQVRK